MTYVISRTTKGGDKRWTGYYYLAEKRPDANGNLKAVAVSAGTCDTEAGAIALADAKQREVNFGLKPDPDIRATMSIAAFVPIFLTKHRMAANTRDGHRQWLTRHVVPTFAGVAVNEVTTPILQVFLDRLRDKGATPSTLHHIRSALRGMFAYARRIGLISTNPARNLAVDTVMRKGERAWAPDVFNAVRPHFKTEAARIFAILQVLTGARISELCALRRADVDLTAGEIHITKAVVVLNAKHNNGERLQITDRPKNGQKRTVGLSTYAKDLLKTYITDNDITDHLFPHHLIIGRGGKKLLGPDTWAYVFRKAFVASGLPESLWVPAKNLRHTHAIDCLERLDWSPARVARRLGHTKEILLSNYVVERLTAVEPTVSELDALDAAYAA